MTNKELQDALNGRLEKFDGEKYTGKEACTPVYHRWYMHEIESELESRGIEIFRAATWKIVAEIDGPGVVKSIRVQFREDLQGLTIEETRAYLLKADLKNRLEYWRKERERLSAELDKAAEKIVDLTSISIEEADV